MTMTKKVWVNVLCISVMLHLTILTALGYYTSFQTPPEKKTGIPEVVEVELGTQASAGEAKSTPSSKGVSNQDNSNNHTAANRSTDTADKSQALADVATNRADNVSSVGSSAIAAGSMPVQGGAASSNAASGNGQSGTGRDGKTGATGKTAAVAVVYSPKPQYPSVARTNSWEGTVLVRVKTSTEGTVLATSIAKSSGYDILDVAALNGLEQWRFTPACQNGKAVSAWVVVPVVFKLQ